MKNKNTIYETTVSEKVGFTTGNEFALTGSNYIGYYCTIIGYICYIVQLLA